MKYRKEMEQAIEIHKIAQALNDSPVGVLDVLSGRDSIFLRNIRVLDIPYKVESYGISSYTHKLTAEVDGVIVFSIHEAYDLSAGDIERCEQ